MAERMKIRQSTLDQQYGASDPAKSSWLSANAGSGKTHVLTQRVIRLMLDGNSPDRIMCLTFTKAAAANMKNRVFEKLASWTMLPDAELDEEIRETTGKKSSPVIRVVARQLFARALDAPGGLKIQTIHGFCESLLHQFPLEANVPGHFETVEPLEQDAMLRRATAEVLSGENPEMSNHYEELVAYASDSQITAGIAAILDAREAFLDWIGKEGIEPAMQELYELFGIEPDDTEATLKQALLEEIPVDQQQFKVILDALCQGTKKTDITQATKLSRFLKSDDAEEKITLLTEICLTKDLNVRTERSMATSAFHKACPELYPLLSNCGSYLVNGMQKLNAPKVLKNSRHLFHLGEAILKQYQAMKRKRGIIDFDDQIERAANLLYREDIQAWIRYRLDMGVDHVLVDEAQDTSPAQWQIINAITSDFYSGEGASSRKRTVFVVGDEKQSIFSFQGAEPKEFDIQRRNLRRRVDGYDSEAYHPGKLTLSFRSTDDVLKAVDTVFANENNRKGLTQAGELTVHDSVRETEPGEVQVWPLYEKEKTQEMESWLDPVDHRGENDPAAKLARRISDEIGSMVGRRLPGMERPLEYRDILVLVRSRNRFITALTRTMKEAGLAIAGADRLKLTEHIAVEDLLAIGKAALLPQDDLSLACSLKGLLFNLSEDDLFAFAYGRKKHVSLYENIILVAGDPSHPLCKLAREIADQFEDIRSLAQSTSVFEFYSRLLGEYGGRKKILSRLGSEAEDVLDVFVDEALAHTRNKNGELESFLSEIAKSELEIKREVELNRDEVRILTVHASKGLEAPVVFLVDSCGPAWRGQHRPALMVLDASDGPNPMVWIPSAKLHTPETLKATQMLEEAAEAEYRRLLYVGMTRAADRLVVCGYKGSNAIKHDYWHAMVSNALQPGSSSLSDHNGEIAGFRWVKKEHPPVAAEKCANAQQEEAASASLPGWLFKKAKPDPPIPRPLSPSGASALIEDEANVQNSSLETGSLEGSVFALKKGNVTHKLLEVLPEILPEDRHDIARNHVNRVCAEWSEAQREDLLGAVFSILDAEEYKALFTGQSRAEIAIAGWVNTTLGSLQISGQIDRLVISGDRVMILDYKTNYSIPVNEKAVPSAYKVQLTLYRELVRQVYPGKRISSAFLWTQAPQLMVMPDAILDEALTLFNKS